MNYRPLCYLLAVVFLSFSGCRKNDSNIFHRIDPADFLSAKKYDQLLVEVQYMGGQEPTQAMIDNLRSFLGQRLNKPGGISIVQTVIAPQGKFVYSLTDIKSIEEKNRTYYTRRGKLTVYVLIVDGEYAGNSGGAKVLGVAYDYTSICIFGKTMSDYSGGTFQPSPATLETTVVQHEFGHLVGLVNKGTPLQSAHQDGANGHHCTNANCLMYYSVETTDFVSNLVGGNVPELDADCIRDLQANGGK